MECNLCSTDQIVEEIEAIIALRDHMASNGLEIKTIFTDEQRHKWPVIVHGEQRTLTYITARNPLDKDLNCPVLIARYSLTNEKPNYTFSSDSKKKI